MRSGKDSSHSRQRGCGELRATEQNRTLELVGHVTSSVAAGNSDCCGQTVLVRMHSGQSPQVGTGHVCVDLETHTGPPLHSQSPPTLSLCFPPHLLQILGLISLPESSPVLLSLPGTASTWACSPHSDRLHAWKSPASLSFSPP